MALSTHVAFIRAINVAGHPSLRMNVARSAFAEAGGVNVRTCIQSGNVLFDCPTAEAAVITRKARIRLLQELGSEPEVVLRSVSQLEELIGRAPFSLAQMKSDAKLYVAFLARPCRTKPRLPFVSGPERLEAIAMTDREVFVVSRRKPNGFYGFPNNFVEGELGGTATTRNWSTLQKILQLMETRPADRRSR